MAEVESKICDITNLATKAALKTKATEIENKICDTTGFITTPEFNRLTKLNFNARMEEEVESLASKGQVDTALDIADTNRGKNFKKFDLSYFNGRKHFGNDGSQHYLILQPISNTFRMVTGDTVTVIEWKSKGLPCENN